VTLPEMVAVAEPQIRDHRLDILAS